MGIPIMIRAFCADGDCSVANATADLLMMAAWHCALDSIYGESIPVSCPCFVSQYDFEPLSYTDILFCARRSCL